MTVITFPGSSRRARLRLIVERARLDGPEDAHQKHGLDFDELRQRVERRQYIEEGLMFNRLLLLAAVLAGMAIVFHVAVSASAALERQINLISAGLLT